MKLRFLITLPALFLISIFTYMNAQSYTKLWQDVEAMAKKDLPRSALEITEKIFQQALKEKNSPEMMKAYLYKMNFRQSISPDSVYVDIKGLEEWVENTKEPLDLAILHSMLGEIYGEFLSNTYYQYSGGSRIMGQPDDAEEWMPTSLIQKSFNHLRASLTNKELLSNTNTATYRPVVTEGESSAYYQHDMLHMLGMRAVSVLKSNERIASEYYPQTTISANSNPLSTSSFLNMKFTPLSDFDYNAEILNIYQEMLRYYKNMNNRSAALMTDLERLSYLADNEMPVADIGNNAPKAFSNIPYYKHLQEMLTEYADADNAIEIYIRMAQFAQQQNQLTEALRLAREGISKYPKARRVNILKNHETEILLPNLYGYMDDTAYPSNETPVRINYKNLNGITLKIYKVNLPADSDQLSKYTERSFRSSYTKLLTTQQFNLDPTLDYQSKDTTLKIATPNEGIYLLEVISDQKSVESSYNLLYVTKLKVINHKLPDNTYEFIVLDSKSGHPVPKAELKLYKQQYGKYQLINSLTADNNGTVTFANDNSDFLVRAINGSDNNMKPVSIGYSYYRQNNNSKIKEVINVFTDRSIYRPGQTVYVGGIAYQQEGDSTNIISNKIYTMQLFDVNNKMVAEKEVRTNEFGSFSGEFILPSSTLTGNFRLKVGDNNKYIKVEEYKRPTFQLTFMPQEGSYSVGDRIMVKGTSKTFSGVPLQNSVVRYTITRQAPMFWWRMGSPKVLASGEVNTDDNGEFRIEVYLEPNDEYKGLRTWYSTYIVEATVTDGAGETQTGTLNLPAGSSSVILSSDLPEEILKEDIPTITLTARNLNQQPVNLTGNYSIVKLVENKEKREESGEILSGNFTSNTTLDTQKINSLSSGLYRLKLSAKDDQNREVTYETDFILYSVNDKVPPVKRANWFHVINDKFDANKPATVIFGSSEEDVYVIYDIFTGDKRIKTERLKLSNSVMKFEYPYKKEYGDGILVQISFVKDGQLYQNEARIIKPIPQKELKMKWEVFRDKLKPGQQEEWILNIEYPDGKPAEAELLATMYDASLDKIWKHTWSMNVDFPRLLPYINWNQGYSGNSYIHLDFKYTSLQHIPLVFDDLITSSMKNSPYLYSKYSDEIVFTSEWGAALPANGMMMKSRSSADFAVAESAMLTGGVAEQSQEEESDMQLQDAGATQLRENFTETAFFYPHLRADKEGKVKITFTMPESLTEWNFMGISHTRKMDWGKLTGKTVTSKDFMVSPNLPRFIRVGDNSSIATNIINLSAKNVSGTVTMQLFNPETEKVIISQKQNFNIQAGKTESVRFDFSITTEEEELLACRIIADGGEFSDGEQRYIPVLSNKTRITESIPFTIRDKDTQTYSLSNLYNNNSNTATNRSLTIEYTGNPAWYAVQALPSLSNPTNDNAISWASAYYANNIAAYIANSNPRIQAVFNSWKAQDGTKETLWSNLQKNPELKNILLEETPWLTEAKSEAEQKQRLALLFDLNNLKNNNSTAIQKLKSLQLPDGSWTWYKGMSGSRYITQYVVESLTRLKLLTGMNFDDEMQQMYNKAFEYLNQQILKEYDQAKEMEKKKQPYGRVPEITVHYLYIAALADFNLPEKNRTANKYFIDKLPKSIRELSVYGKALTAVILYKSGNRSAANDFMKSLQEYAVSTKDMGMYYDAGTNIYAWYNYRIPTQVAVIEATDLITQDTNAIEEMKIWLLKQKQTQSWDSPNATANAVYALLSRGGNMLDNKGSATIKVGKDVIKVTPENSMVPGLAYIKKTYNEEEAKKAQEVTVTTLDDGLSWGAIYAQYQEEIDKVAPVNKELSVEKRLFIERMTEGKPQLIPLTGETKAKVGDKVITRLTVRTDRDVDFVHLKDQRAACFEPYNALSGYRNQGGAGYYLSIKDASTDFFFDNLRKGTYVFEQAYYVVRTGDYSSGIATLQSMYAPEFSAHSASIRVKVD